MSYRSWGTLLELKENHITLGLKGWIFFIVDFPQNIETGELLYMIAQPTFTGLGVSKGISSYILKKNKIEELFNIMDINFNEYSKELEEDYFKND